MIPNSSKITICFLAIVILVGFFAAIVVNAAFNPQINYQGKLTDTNDVAVTDEDYNMEFKLWATSTATSSEYLKWTETCTSSDDKITVTNGLFSHLLGSVHSFSADDVDFNQTLWLEVSIAGTTTDPTSSDWETLSPRKKLGAVPAAFVAEKIGDYGTSSIAILSEDETITGAWTFNNILSAAASSSSAVLTVNQTGSGNLVDFQVATTSKFVINNSGEITTGEWKATPIGTQWGGTGQDWSTTATGSIPFATSTGVFDLLAPGTSDYYLKSQGAGASPVWAEVSATNYYGPTIIVAASDSTSTDRAHYQCSGTDDQVEINNAINALPAGIGGTVLLLEGNYSIATSGIDITTSSVALVGSGKGTVLQRAWDAASNDGVITVGDGTNSYEGITIANLSIDGQKGSYGGIQNIGIYFNKKITKSKIQNTWVHDCDGMGIYLYGASGAENTQNLIEGNDIRDGDYHGIYLYYSGNNKISDNHTYNNGHDIYIANNSNYNTITGNIIDDSSYCSNSGILIEAAGNSVIGNVIRNKCTGINVSSNYNSISGNNIYYSQGLDVAGDYNSITGNNFYYNSDQSDATIELSNADHNLITSNNVYSNRYKEGIYLTGSTFNNIVGNNVYNSSDHGISLDSSDNNVISSNVVRKSDNGNTASYDGIYLVNDSDNNIISSNRLEDNDRYEINISTSTCNNNYLIGNDTYGTDHEGEINDDGTGTVIQHKDWFEVEASSTIAALTVQQDGSGNIVEFKNATGTVFTIATSGNATLAGDFLPATTTEYDLGSSTYKWANLYAATTTLDAFKMATGASSGYILTAATSGVGTWQQATDKKGPTIIVAASDSKSTSTADYVCSGTSCEDEINSALSALPSIGGTIKLLEGTYTMATSTYSTSSICVTSSVAIIGSGASTVLRIKDSFNANLNVICNTDTTNGNFRILISNLKLDGNKDNNTSGDQNGIYFSRVGSGTGSSAKPGAKIENLWVENFRDYTIFFDRCDNNTIINNTILNNDSTGIYLDNYSNRNTISGNTVQGNGGTGIYIKDDYNTITGNIVQGNSYSGIHISGSGYNTITSNLIEGNSQHGINLYSASSEYNVIAGNKIHNNGGSSNYHGITLADGGPEYNLISSNDITDTAGTGYAISIASNSSNNYLIGNRYSGTGASSIQDGSPTTIYGSQLYGTSTSADLILKPLGNVGIGTKTPSAFLDVYASTTASALTVQQDGSGNIVEIKNATGTVFTIASSGNATLAGDFLPATTTTYDLGSSTYKWANLYSATATLDVFKMATGATSGYVLTAATSGVGTWQAAAGGTDTNYYGPTVIVAASDSTSTSRAHYQCSGTDDQVQINNAINALPGGIGGTVLLLEGTYYIATSGIDITTSSVALIGSGSATILKRMWNETTANNSGMITITSVSTDITDIFISQLQIDGNRGNYNNSNNHGIFLSESTSGLEYPKYIQIKNNWVNNNAGNGIYVEASNWTDVYYLFEGNIIRNNSENGIYIDDLDAITITGNTIEGNTENGIWLSFSGYSTITGNTIEGNSDDGIYISSSAENTVSGNTIKNNDGGIFLSGSQSNTISGNSVVGNTGSLGGIYISDDFNSVTGNIIEGNMNGWGIIIAGGDDNAIVGNKIHNNGGSGPEDGIDIGSNADRNLISSNDITDTDGSGYAIDIASGCDNTYLVGNRYSGTGASVINDAGGSTKYTQDNRITIEANDTDYGSAVTALTVTQSGTGKIVDVVANLSSTSTVVTLLELRRETSGTAGSGIGGAILFKAEALDGSVTSTAQIVSTYNAATSTPEGDLRFYTKNTVGTLSERMRIDKDGNIGIGTTTPTHTFEVIAGSGAAVCDTDANCAAATTTAGNLYATSRTGGEIDIAEWIRVGEENLDENGKTTLEPGDLLCIDPQASNKVIACTSTYDENIIGVVSTRPHLTMGMEERGEDAVRMALSGRVPIKVSTENGLIEVGDPLTSALSMPGVAMKTTQPGQIIGYALEPFGLQPTSTATTTATTTEAATTTPKILVFINPGFSLGSLDESGNLSLLKSNFNATSSSTSTSATSTETTILSRFTQAVRNALAKLGLVVENGIAKVKKLVAGIVRVDGLEMVDKATGEIWCTWIENGEQVRVKGECEAEISDQTSTENQATDCNTVYYYDNDGDGYGYGSFFTACEQPEGYAPNKDDCDDYNPEINPGAVEVCDDGIDNNCDGQIDEGCGVATATESATSTESSSTQQATTTTEATTTEATTTEATTTPSTSSGQAEATTTEPVCQPQTFYLDADGDGYGDSANTISSCEQPAGYVLSSDDCDDTNSNINPAAFEVCDGADNNCDGQIDEDLIQQCGSSDIGACQFGTQTCQAGVWGECQGIIEPIEEICDDNLDNNCDGQVDEDCQAEEPTTTTVTTTNEQ